jgi:glutaconate CoA-transferase subunit B
VIPTFSRDEVMTVAAARALDDRSVCFVGIGLPSTACNLARALHAPNITLIYETGTLRARPDVLPLSIGDGELCETALTTVSVPEMFRYWLQGERISIGFLGAAQIDRFANINTTVIGPYGRPTTRLPGGGGAPEIATQCGEVFVTLKHSARAFVERLDFVTSLGFGRGAGDREALGVRTRGPTRVFTDLATLEPDAATRELTVRSIHPGVDRAEIVAATGWPIRFADDVAATPPPTERELSALRDLQRRSADARAVAT